MKTALVVSGGGSKGAFAVGALEYMINKLGLKFDLIAGTSTGSLIAPFIAAGDLKALGNLYLDMKTEHFLTPRNIPLAMFFKDAIFDVKPFHKVLNHVMKKDRARRVFASNAKIFIATVALQSGDIVYFHTMSPGTAKAPAGSRLCRIRDRVQLLKVMEASSNQPVFMSPVKVKTAPNQKPENVEQFVDGGVREYAPIRIVLENGATHVYAIVLSPGRSRHKGTLKSGFSILARTFGLFMEDVGESDIVAADLLAQQKGAKIKYVRPSKPLRTNSLKISTITQGKLMELGRAAAKQAGTL